ncbi:hypothetical protein [Tepidibacillus fermentans]|uniref:Uncharacterized protein n=1 Tax=Tepidibacillus fermentans TaxID=1281767 RepID=A0A4R3K9K4_9BACI|nr:hypothetical protein [Tepidibacillus fermentans]TCS79585.1 hypothetical protein EDD72_12057 [Tepidibacillus fermentans]
MDILFEERPSYLTLLTRKSSLHKTIETIIFIVFVVVLAFVYGFTSSFFKVGVLISAGVVLFLSPVAYSWIVRPQYILTETELIIKKMNQKTSVPYARIEDAYDLRFIFKINGEKEVLSVSDAFIDELNERLYQFKLKK